jgi:hypothetical protein
LIIFKHPILGQTYGLLTSLGFALLFYRRLFQFKLFFLNLNEPSPLLSGSRPVSVPQRPYSASPMGSSRSTFGSSSASYNRGMSSQAPMSQGFSAPNSGLLGSFGPPQTYAPAGPSYGLYAPPPPLPSVPSYGPPVPHGGTQLNPYGTFGNPNQAMSSFAPPQMSSRGGGYRGGKY